MLTASLHAGDQGVRTVRIGRWMPAVQMTSGSRVASELPAHIPVTSQHCDSSRPVRCAGSPRRGTEGAEQSMSGSAIPSELPAHMPVVTQHVPASAPSILAASARSTDGNGHATAPQYVTQQLWLSRASIKCASTRNIDGDAQVMSSSPSVFPAHICRVQQHSSTLRPGRQPAWFADGGRSTCGAGQMMSGSSFCRLLPVHMPVVTQHAATSRPRVTFAFSTSIAWRLSQTISDCCVAGVLPVQNPQRLGGASASAVLTPE